MAKILSNFITMSESSKKLFFEDFMAKVSLNPYSSVILTTAFVNAIEHFLFPSDVLLYAKKRIYSSVKNYMTIYALRNTKQIKKLLVVKCGNFHVELRNF